MGIGAVALVTLAGARFGGEGAARNIVESERHINFCAKQIQQLHAKYLPYNNALADAAKPHAIRTFGFTAKEFDFLKATALQNNFPAVRSIDALAWALKNGGISKAREKLADEIQNGEFNTETFKHFVILSSLEQSPSPLLKGILKKIGSKLDWLEVPKDLPHDETAYTRFGRELYDRFKASDNRSAVNTDNAQQIYHDIASQFKDMVKSKNDQYWSRAGVYWSRTALPVFAEGQMPSLMQQAGGLEKDTGQRFWELSKRRK